MFHPLYQRAGVEQIYRKGARESTIQKFIYPTATQDLLTITHDGTLTHESWLQWHHVLIARQRTNLLLEPVDDA